MRQVESRYFLIVAIASVAGSVLVGQLLVPSLSHFSHQVNLQHAEAAPLPLGVEDNYEIKEKVGDAASSKLKIEDNFIDDQRHCEFCTKIEYTPGSEGIAGFSYGSSPTDLSSAKKVRFFVMGEDGGEKVKFKVAGKDSAATKPGPQGKKSVIDNEQAKPLFKEKFAKNTEEIALSNDWKRIEVDLTESLTKSDLTGVTSLFGVEVLKGKGSAKQAFYIKGIVFDTEPVDSRFAVAANTTTTLLSLPSFSVGIIANSTEGNVSDTFEFAANVSGGTEPYDIQWDYDDETHDEGETVTHKYDAAGEYNVTVLASDSQGQNASSSILISVTEEAAIPPEVQPEEDNATAETNETTTSSNNDTAEDVPSDIIEGDSANQTDSDEASDPETIADSDDGNNNTSTDAEAEGGGNNTEEEGENNSPPSAIIALEELTARGNEDVILDAGESQDPDGDELSYQWSQSSGPEVNIEGSDSAYPSLSIPEVDEDEEIVVDLIVSDGIDESEEKSVTISIPHVEEVDDSVDASFMPADDDGERQWQMNDNCEEGGFQECLTDDSEDTFVSTDQIDDTDMFAIQDLELEENDDIQYITAVLQTKKTGESGFLKFVIGDSEDADDSEATDGISITSNGFQQYSYTWKENVLTGDQWAVDDLDSLMAGYQYAGGESAVQISEFKLVITYIEAEEEEPVPAPEDESEVDTEEEETDADSQEVDPEAEANTDEDAGAGEDDDASAETTTTTDSENADNESNSTNSDPETASEEEDQQSEDTAADDSTSESDPADQEAADQ